jgi:hypothetical protein
MKGSVSAIMSHLFKVRGFPIIQTDGLQWGAPYPLDQLWFVSPRAFHRSWVMGPPLPSGVAEPAQLITTEALAVDLLVSTDVAFAG